MEKNFKTLEDLGEYRQRNGEVVRVMKRTDKEFSSDVFNWISSNGNTYRIDGTYEVSASEISSYDLIEKIEETKPLKLEVGKSYEDRIGNVHEISVYNKDVTFPYLSVVGVSWLGDGSYRINGFEHDADLIKEVPTYSDEEIKKWQDTPNSIQQTVNNLELSGGRVVITIEHIKE